MRIQIPSQTAEILHNPEFQKNVIDRLDTKNITNCEFFSIPYSKPLRDCRKPKFEIWDRIRISKFDLPFRNGYKSQFTQ